MSLKGIVIVYPTVTSCVGEALCNDVGTPTIKGSQGSTL